MKERPILFSGPMVRALLDGRKTQTRRVLKVQPDFSIIKQEFKDAGLWEFRKRFMLYDDWSGYEHAMYRKTERGDPDLPVYQHRSPFGEPGDRLWVREAIRLVPGQEPDDGTGRVLSTYNADGALTVADAWPWKRSYLPPMHCPRGLSRITLEVTGVRIERLNDITDADAEAEGWPGFTDDNGLDSMAWYSDLWDDLNMARGYGWDVNPWVWVVEFKRA